MIGLSLQEIAAVTGGTFHGDPTLVVPGPAFVDSRLVSAGGLFVAVVGEHVDGHDYVGRAVAAGAVAVLASHIVAAPCVVVQDVIAALGKVARVIVDRRPDLRVIGITGSQGKTSVKDLLAHVLAAHGATVASTGSFNNELGVPLTVLRIDAATRFLVVEMGARGIGHIATLCAIAPPTIAVVLNVGVAHLGEFGSPENIARAKGELVEALPSDGTAVLNADDARVAAMATRTSAAVSTFGVAGAVVPSVVVLDDLGQPHFTLSHGGEQVRTSVPQLGAHHVTNAAAAAAVALAVGMPLADIGAALATATVASPMRMARAVRADGVVVINDAYNANPDSMAAALRALTAVRGAGRTVAVLGEMLELGAASRQSHFDLGELAARLGVSCVVAVGPGAAAIAEGAGERGHRVADVAAAVSFLTPRLAAGDVVLVKASRGERLERVAAALLDP